MIKQTKKNGNEYIKLLMNERRQTEKAKKEHFMNKECMQLKRTDKQCKKEYTQNRVQEKETDR